MALVFHADGTVTEAKNWLVPEREYPDREWWFYLDRDSDWIEDNVTDTQ